MRFHDPSGAGYRFLADQILAVDGFNPMTAARLVEPLGGWRRYMPELGALMKAELKRTSSFGAGYQDKFYGRTLRRKETSPKL